MLENFNDRRLVIDDKHGPLPVLRHRNDGSIRAEEAPSILLSGDLPTIFRSIGYRFGTMSAELSAAAVESVLHEQILAHLAYTDRRGRPCIIPISYAYDGDSLYGYSLMGAKIEGMSAHPDVSIEVDHIENSADWRTVIARGTFERLEGHAAVQAVERISERLRTVALADHAAESAEHTYVGREGGPGIAYRIRLREKHGRISVPTY
jgi:nitroimidazol reductase NimA-like FMN-containing flavoprotein (pyridoxamine 5'-phosphate oxidase superfamily)